MFLLVFNGVNKVLSLLNSGIPLYVFLTFVVFLFFVGNFRKTEEQKPKEQRPKASENKPVMNE